MRKTQVFLALALLVLAGLSHSVLAQTTAEERAAALRQQLVHTQAKELDLQTRLAQVEEASKPENIEKSLAGFGSTRPEELREQRRREFEIQKKSLQSQLSTLAASKTRLEAGILQADADAYHQSAGVSGAAGEKSSGGLPSNASPQSKGSVSAPLAKSKSASVRRVRRHKARARRVRKAVAP